MVASLEDALVRQSDLDLLDGPLWLNDAIIGFYFQHLHSSQFGGSDKICFISPEVSQFLKLASKEEIHVFVDSLNLEIQEVIVMAVNNASDPNRPGGSHWSLLIFSSQSRAFFHFDSSPGLNQDHADQLAKQIHHYLVKKEKEQGVHVFFDFRIIEVDVAKQSNGYDCGIHVLLNAEHVVRHILVYGDAKGLERPDPSLIKSMRMKVKEEILKYPPKATTTAL